MKIFYSWQSDIEKDINCNFIQRTLNAAVSKIEVENPGIVIPVDRDTKDKSGAINIVETILNKIKESKILVFDISIINGRDNGRKCINPNVAFELGFGVAYTGWENIILVFNEAYGNIDKDIPFDIRGHRILTYFFDGSLEKKKVAFNDLTTKLKAAIETIVFNEQYKNTHSDLNEYNMRQNDEKMVCEIFSTVYLPSIDRFCLMMEESLSFNTDVFHYYEGIKALLNSSLYYLYDKELEKSVEKFFNAFRNCLRFEKHAQGEGSICRIRPNDKNIESEILKSIEVLKIEFKKLVTYCKSNYPSLNINEITKEALKEYRNFMEENFK
ncbi:hypothetical protein QBE52_15600 [Clostridiaceae bacterium 35-E11]